VNENEESESEDEDQDNSRADRRGRPPMVNESNVAVSSRGRNIRNTNQATSSSMNKFQSYKDPTRMSRTERAKLRNVRRGVWSDEQENENSES
jgi:hypothetical protein